MAEARGLGNEKKMLNGVGILVRRKKKVFQDVTDTSGVGLTVTTELLTLKRLNVGALQSHFHSIPTE